MDIVYGHSAIKPCVTRILKQRELLSRDNTGIPGSFGKQLIPLFDVATHNQTAAVFIQLVEAVGHLLAMVWMAK